MSPELRSLNFSQKTSDGIDRIKHAIRLKMKDYFSYNGYNKLIKNNGFIIAISLSKIDFPNVSPSKMDASLSELNNFIHQYSQLSAVIISYTWEGLFPDLTKNLGFAVWPEHTNDYPVIPHPGDIRILYNAFATINLPRKLLPATSHRETITENKDFLELKKIVTATKFKKIIFDTMIYSEFIVEKFDEKINSEAIESLSIENVTALKKIAENYKKEFFSCANVNQLEINKNKNVNKKIARSSLCRTRSGIAQ